MEKNTSAVLKQDATIKNSKLNAKCKSNIRLKPAKRGLAIRALKNLNKPFRPLSPIQCWGPN